MAKKGDILLKCYNEFPEYYETYKSRLEELEREFLHAKNDTQDYLNQVEEKYTEKEKRLTTKFYEIELIHNEKIKEIRNEFASRLNHIDSEIIYNTSETNESFSREDELYQNILNQFEERKAEAFNTYLQLTKETNFRIDREMKVHKQFIDQETVKIDAKRIEYQDLNSNLSNQLLWTMEKAKNALTKLSTSLTEEGNANKEFLDDTINQSLIHLNNSKEAMSAMFKNTTLKFEKERNIIRSISKEKRKPHSEINQKMIRTFVKQIRDVNENKVAFEQMIISERELSLSRVYPKIIDADISDDFNELRKYILQKEIVEKKAEYLLNRNKTMSDLLISKYQNEIKKIKIDSFKRLEEIKLAYQAPEAFFQNSVNVYSNFAFYFNETYEDLYRMLDSFKQYNTDYTKYKTDYIHNTQKSFEDYKINLLVKVNDITNRLTEYISKIDQLSHEIVTLESNNRLEIAEIRKRMENLEIFGDYQKYIASLENDQFFAMFQHNKNIEKIQIEANYVHSLLNINKEVLLLNQSKLEYNEYQDYMLKVAKHENTIQEIAYNRKLDETKALYLQKIEQVKALTNLTKHRIIHNAMKTNYGYAKTYVDYLSNERQKNSVGSVGVIDFIQHAQELININELQVEKINETIDKSKDDHAYLRALEKQRFELLLQVDNTAEKKNRICRTALKIYHDDISKVTEDCRKVITKYQQLLKDQLLLEDLDFLQGHINYENTGYLQEITSVIEYVQNKVIKLAYKYQAPDVIKDLDKTIEKYLGDFVFNNITSLRKIKRRKNPKRILTLFKSYYIETYKMMTEFEHYITKILKHIEDSATKSDRLFIENTLKKAEKTKDIINKEYERLEFEALRIEKSKKKQIDHLKNHSDKINQLYKKQVKTLNDDYLQKVRESDEIAKIINKKFTKIIEKNNKELNSMLKFLEKMTIKEHKMLEKQHKKFEQSLSAMEQREISNHLLEIQYINTLYKEKENDTSKTIMVLEKRITDLPADKENSLVAIQKERSELQRAKRIELQKLYAELEKDKFVSRPKYLEEIDRVKKRLPDDYVRLYGEIQNLEFDYLNQFTKINQEYKENYQEYILNQSGNNEVLENNSMLYSPFDAMNQFYEKGLKDT